MRRSFLLYIFSAAVLVLTFIFAAPDEPMDIEGMKVAQVMGIDLDGDRLRLSVCTAGDEPERISASGRSISEAMTALDEKAVGGSILYDHVSAVFLSEELCGEGMQRYLDYFTASDTVRMDIPIYIIRASSAADAVAAGSDKVGAGELAENIRSRAELKGGGAPTTVSGLSEQLLRNGSGLVSALRVTASADGGGTSLESAGLCLVRSGVPAGFIEEDDANVAALLMGRHIIYTLDIADADGESISLEVSGGRSHVKPCWNDAGELAGIDIELDVSADIIEGSAEDFSGGEAELQRVLEQNISVRAERVLRRCRTMGTDFLELGRRVEMAAPGRFRNISEDFDSVLGSVEIRLTVTAEV